jgi:hypothetical protein
MRVAAGAAGPVPQVVLLDPDVDPTALRTEGGVTTRSASEARRAAGADPGRRLRQVD